MMHSSHRAISRPNVCFRGKTDIAQTSGNVCFRLKPRRSPLRCGSQKLPTAECFLPESSHHTRSGVIDLYQCYALRIPLESLNLRSEIFSEFAMRKSLLALSLTVIFSAATSSVSAQQTTGTPGSPSATTTIDGAQIPAPPQKLGGTIERRATRSKPYRPSRIVPPKGAPNFLLIITDDAGFGVPSTFGGVIPTPALDRIARDGLRYTNFHSTALCSPTRAALITGRNHHSAGYGVVAEQATGYPGYDSIITKDKATIGPILTDNGYHTAWFGKNHNTPEYQASQAGPFDQWPTGMGFEYFYGFMGGDTNQWEPGNLVRNTTPIYPYLGKPGWNLVTAMADEAIEYMNRINALSPETSFFIKFAPGATHAPHHPTAAWVKKISDMHL